MVFLEEGRLIFSHNILECFLDSKERYFHSVVRRSRWWFGALCAGRGALPAPAQSVVPPLANLLSCDGSEEYFYKYLLPTNLK